MASDNSPEPVQFERQGYFVRDADSKPGALVFNRTVGLRDTWAKVAGGKPLDAVIPGRGLSRGGRCTHNHERRRPYGIPAACQARDRNDSNRFDPCSMPQAPRRWGQSWRTRTRRRGQGGARRCWGRGVSSAPGRSAIFFLPQAKRSPLCSARKPRRRGWRPGCRSRSASESCFTSRRPRSRRRSRRWRALGFLVLAAWLSREHASAFVIALGLAFLAAGFAASTLRAAWSHIRC